MWWADGRSQHCDSKGLASMNKSTKGAFAAVTAAVLLLGGAGSLAYWTDEGTADGGAITSGTMSIGDGTCGAWSYSGGSQAGQPVTLIVPGDAVTKSCTFTIDATGDHLSADLSVPATLAYTPSAPAPSLELTASATYTVGATAGQTVVTSADDGETLTVAFVVTFPFGDATTINVNDTQGLTTTLDALTVTLTQSQNAANPNA
jgi:alternate signal-mediated exported protein